uniref:Uncharacterized protein n=1 Tax=Rhizophora mucronata TaxID=61149 RepID=A0A2P2KC16_RHIMU
MAICSPSSPSESAGSSSAKSWIVHGVVAGAAIAVAIGAHAYLGRFRKFRSRVVGIIPARYASSRFPGKPLVDILGKPMIQVIPICPLPQFIVFPFIFTRTVFLAMFTILSDLGGNRLSGSQ